MTDLEFVGKLVTLYDSWYENETYVESVCFYSVMKVEGEEIYLVGLGGSKRTLSIELVQDLSLATEKQIAEKLSELEVFVVQYQNLTNLLRNPPCYLTFRPSLLSTVSQRLQNFQKLK